MNLRPATKAETKELEHTTQHLSNFLNHDNYGSSIGRIRHLWYLKIYGDLIGWYHQHGLTTSHPIKSHIHKLSVLFDCKPTYHAVRGSGGYRNAIWGFWNEDKSIGVVVYESLRGLTIQAQGLTPKTHRELLLWFKKRILKEVLW